MVDPSTAELEGFSTLADVFNWAGLSDPLRTALNEELGDLRLIRELASIPVADLEDAIKDLDITIDGSGRKIKAVEKTRVRLARTACRLRCGLPKDVDTSSGTVAPVQSWAQWGRLPPQLEAQQPPRAGQRVLNWAQYGTRLLAPQCAFLGQQR